MEKVPGGDGKKLRAVGNAEACLGCGVCSTVCKNGAASMKPRSRRVLVPETLFDQRIAMALERGKLANAVRQPEKLSQRALAKIVGALEKSALFQTAMAKESIKSSFLEAMAKGAKRKAGKLADMLT
jgi:ferredoxin